MLFRSDFVLRYNCGQYNPNSSYLGMLDSAVPHSAKELSGLLFRGYNSLHLFTGTGLKKAASYRSINTELSDKIEHITDLLATDSKPKRPAGRNNHNINIELKNRKL